MRKQARLTEKRLLVDPRTVKDFVAACNFASRLPKLLPPLPAGVTPRGLYVVDVIRELSADGPVQVSDVSARLKLTRPSITKTIGEMTDLGYLSKQSSKSDGRTVFVSLTSAGEALWQRHIAEYYTHAASLLDGISEQDLREASQTIIAAVEAFERIARDESSKNPGAPSKAQ